MLHASGDTPGTTTNGGRVIANDVFIDAADASPPTDGASGERRLVRLPPARADGKLEASLGGPPARTLEGAGEGAREMWGYSLRVNPVFPSESGSAHPWLTQRFEAFTALVWGEQGHAHASNIELVRYGNMYMYTPGLCNSFSAVGERSARLTLLNFSPQHGNSDMPLLETKY